MLLIVVAWFLAARARSAPVPTPTDTVLVSGAGVSNHGKPNLVCFPTSPMDIAVFFFVNYVAHAANARVPAGASTWINVKVIIDSLCSPVLRARYALDAIAQWTVGFKKQFPFITLPEDSLETAHRAGALITACREDNWVPDPKDKGYMRKGVTVKGENINRIAKNHEDGQKEEWKRWVRFGQPDKQFNIFGGDELPKGYGWVYVPWDVTVEPPQTNTLMDISAPDLGSRRPPTDLGLPSIPLGATYSLFQSIAAVVQAISAAVTLYKTRGDQLDRYGFTAFGLTVVPYLVMSIVNFFASLAVPKYNALYIVQSDILDEATIRLGDSIPRRCVVGKLPYEKSAQEKPQVQADEDSPNHESVVVRISEPEGGQAASGWKTVPCPKHEGESIDEPKNESERGSRPLDEVIVSRFPSVELTNKTRPLGHRTISVLHWIIGLSTLAIISIISRLQLGTETRRLWKNFFIVWLFFSCLSAMATSVAKSVCGFILGVCVGFVQGIYKLFSRSSCWGRMPGDRKSVKDKAEGLAEDRKNKQSSSTVWYDIYSILMFISEWIFFVLFLVMVGQQLVDYGDCSYFSS